MNKNLLEEHLQLLDKLKTKKPTVFIYKGFPNHFLKDLSVTIPHIDKLIFMNEKGQMDLQKIIANKNNLPDKIKKVKENKTFITFEEFLLIPAAVLDELNVNFKVIKNNFYEFYPNQTNTIFPDIEESINSEVDVEENKLFVTFYADCRQIADYNCVQYLDYEMDLNTIGIPVIDFFDADEVSLPSFNADVTKSKNAVQFQSSDSSYPDLKYGIFNNKIPKEINLLVDESIDHLAKDLEELKLLYKILSKSGCTITLCRQEKIYKDYWRPELNDLLKKHWGPKAEFKKLKLYKKPDTTNEMVDFSQGSVIEHIVQQVEKAQNDLLFEDVFLTAPTGAGKSLLFQLPAIYLSESAKLNSVTIVVSPLKALMYDQVQALKADRNFDKVAFINSDLSLVERQELIDKTVNGEISILYMSPELLLAYNVQTFIGTRELGLLIIDEAHLVTTWGRDFRIDYWFLGRYIRKLRSAGVLKGKAKNKYKTYRFPVVALTATAVYNGIDDMVFDTIRTLNMQNCRTYIGRIKREEISFDYQKLEVDKHNEDKIVKTKLRIQEQVDSNKKSIFYFPWVSQIRPIMNAMEPELKQVVKRYYGELGSAERAETLKDFKSGKAKVVIATKAFGMGVDISDIELVYHHAPSGSLADYVQEIGRVARIPGMKGTAKIDFNPKDLNYSRLLFMISSIKQFQMDHVIRKLNKLYLINKQRNLVVSIEDFMWIFSKDYNPEDKVKSSMLVLEKDLFAKYGYNVIIVKPKSMFNTAFCSVDDEGYKLLKEKYGKCITEVKRSTYDRAGTKLKNGAIVMREEKGNKKDVKITLDKLWENYFASESFPDIRKKFFDKRLFPYVEPLMKLRVFFNGDVDATFKKLENGIDFIASIFASFGGKLLKREALIKKFQERLKNEITCTKLADFLISSFVDVTQFGSTGKAGMAAGTFLQLKQFNMVTQYRYDYMAFGKVKTQLLRNYQITFDGLKEGSREFIGFIPADMEKAKEKFKMVLLLEMFDLATYEITGGQSPQLLVRINDPRKLAELCKEKYTNNVVADIEKRHTLSSATMTYFFETVMTDKERWNYIEDYFLGKRVATIEPKATEEEENEEVK